VPVRELTAPRLVDVTMTAIWLAIHRFGERDRSDDTKS
jgi:hypothetical protein